MSTFTLWTISENSIFTCNLVFLHCSIAVFVRDLNYCSITRDTGKICTGAELSLLPSSPTSAPLCILLRFITVQGGERGRHLVCFSERRGGKTDPEPNHRHNEESPKRLNGESYRLGCDMPCFLSVSTEIPPRCSGSWQRLTVAGPHHHLLFSQSVSCNAVKCDCHR